MGVSLSESTPSSRSFQQVSIVMSTATRQSRGARETRCGTERLDREHQACSNASRRACQVRPGRNGLRGETQLGRSAFELCESTVDVTQR